MNINYDSLSRENPCFLYLDETSRFLNSYDQFQIETDPNVFHDGVEKGHF